MFIHADFMLETKRARSLYHDFAEALPIIDYHCHLSPRDIAEDRRFENLTSIWLAGDHYKWRAMGRGRGRAVHHRGRDRFEKFEKWAETVPKTLRNPLYHWTHLELSRLFGIDRPLGPGTAPSIWEEANAKLARRICPFGHPRRMNVAALCTTDDPVDDLRHHRALTEAGDFPIRVHPSFPAGQGPGRRSDPEGFKRYTGRLAQVADIEIGSFGRLPGGLRKRHDYFHGLGCRLSDHGLETVLAEDYSDPDIRKTFAAVMAGKTVALIFRFPVQVGHAL